jgi:hypothetical protein
MTIIPVYFKQAYTTNRTYYDVDTTWSTHQFIEFITPLVRTDYEIEEFVFVPFGQNVSLVAEEGLAVVPRYNVSLISLFANESITGFYIRPIIPSPISTLICSICRINERSILFLPCNHLCCCSSCGRLDDLINCPMCRTEIVNRIHVYL